MQKRRRHMIHTAHRRSIRMAASTRGQAPAGQGEEIHSLEEASVALADSVAHKVQEASKAGSRI
jgi:hypothetical protein